MSPAIVDKEAQKEEILSAAAAVFAEKGFSNTKMEDISKRAEIGKGTLYEYFRSKDDLFFALYQNLLNSFHTRIYSSLSPEQTPTEALTAMISATLRAFDEWHDYGMLLLEFWNEHRRGKFLNVNFSDIYDKSRGILKNLIEEGVIKGEFAEVDPMVASSTIIAVLDGILLQRIFEPDLYSKMDVEKHILTIIFGGLKIR